MMDIIDQLNIKTYSSVNGVDVDKLHVAVLAELAALRAENERLREALNEIVSAPSAGGWVPSLQHCVDVAKEALK